MGREAAAVPPSQQGSVIGATDPGHLRSTQTSAAGRTDLNDPKGALQMLRNQGQEEELHTMNYLSLELSWIMISLPSATTRRAWDIVMMVLLVYTAIIVPYNIAFEPLSNPDGTPLTRHTFRWTWGILVDMMFMLDMLLNLVTGYVDGGDSVVEHAKVVKAYAKSWFTVDFIGSLPLDFIMEGVVLLNIEEYDKVPIQDNEVLRIFKLARYFKLLRMARVVRLARLNRYIQQLEDLLRINPGIMRIIRLVVWITLMAHVSACVWFLLGQFSEPGVSWIANYQKCATLEEPCDLFSQDQSYQYLASIYWAFTTMTTVGYGDITPVSPYEMIFAIVEMMGGATLFAYIVGNMASLVDSLDARTKLYKEKMEAVQEFMHQRGLPNELRQRIKQFYDYSFHRNDLFLEERILRELSTGLRSDVAMHIHKDFIEKVPFFKGRDTNFLSQVVMKLKPLQARENQVIFEIGDTGNVMYFINQGTVAVRVRGRVVTRLEAGNYFGEAAMLVEGERRTMTVTAETVVELLLLTKHDLHECAAAFPEVAQDLVEVACDRLVELDKYASQVGVGFSDDSEEDGDSDADYIEPAPLDKFAASASPWARAAGAASPLGRGGENAGARRRNSLRGLSTPLRSAGSVFGAASAGHGEEPSMLPQGADTSVSSPPITLKQSRTSPLTPGGSKNEVTTGSVMKAKAKKRLNQSSTLRPVSGMGGGARGGGGAREVKGSLNDSVQREGEGVCLTCPHCSHCMKLDLVCAAPGGGGGERRTRTRDFEA